MAPDDRDRNLDQALARHFRSSTDARSAATGSPAPQLSPCPDAEILGAYHDGWLTPEELALWKPHVLACGDCQLVLEHLRTPLDAPVALEASTSVLIPAQSTARPAPVVAVAAAAHTSSSSATAGTASDVPAPVAIARRQKTYFRWLVPAGAIAAGLLTWIVIRGSQLSHVAPKIENVSVETAENRSAPAPPPTALSAPASSALPELRHVSPAPNAADQRLPGKVDQLKQELTNQRERQEKDQASSTTALVGGAAGSLNQQTRDTEQQLRGRLPSAQPAPAPLHYAASAGHGPRVTQQQQQAQLVPGATDSNDLAALNKKAEPPAPALIEPGSVAPQPPAKVAQATSAPSPKPAPAEAAKARSPADSVGTVTESVEVETAAPSATMLRTAAAVMPGPQTFTDPGDKSDWRVGPAGSLEFSSDRGVTWTAQSTGVSYDLLTGSAPSAKVCWIVGAKGVILRTTDTGKHWVKIGSPVAVNILGIRAADAFHATIRLQPDSKTTTFETYKTSDGGLTWSLIPNN